MITKEEALGMSIKRWQANLVGQEGGYNPCGYCEYTKARTEERMENTECEKFCPLYPDVCMNDDMSRGEPTRAALYWQYSKAECSAVNRRKLAGKILDEIISRGKIWLLE